MNRIEIIAVFTALKRMVAQDDIEGVSEVVEAVLDEAVTAKRKPKKNDEAENLPN